MIKTLMLFKNIVEKGEKKGELNTRKKRIKFILRTILTFRYSMQLGDFILSHKYLRNTVYSYPILISKIHRPYLYRKMRTPDKLKTIIHTYKVIDSLFNSSTLNELYLKRKITLATITGKENNIFYLSLELYPFFEKEGEINLKLLNDEGIALSVLTFSFLNTFDKNLKLFIGGIQGAPRDKDKELIKKVTKDLYGIFPKKLLIESLYIIEKALNIQIEKFSVGNENHIYKSQRYIRKRVIHSDYDSFLLSLNSKKLNNGNWELPKTLDKKPLEEIPSKKRSLYSNRYSMIENMEEQILNIFK